MNIGGHVLSSPTHTADSSATGAKTLNTGGLAQDPASSEAILAATLASLSDNKAEEVVQIDLRGKTSVCDYMIICSGRSSRQVSALSEKLAEELKGKFGILAKMEGKETGDWVAIDAGDVIVHVFRPEVRDFYQLEKMWQPVGAGVGAGQQ